jgi:hypothetical protein
MKKVLGILAILLMLSGVSMAATMSDADLAAVTGQAGVTIDVSNLNMYLQLNTITYGDLDGFAAATDAGYVNIAFYPAPMYVGIQGLNLVVDVGTDTAGTGTTSVNIAATVGKITVLALIVDVYLTTNDGVHDDFMSGTASAYTHTSSTWTATASITNSIGRIGISGLSITLPTAVNIKISAH